MCIADISGFGSLVLGTVPVYCQPVEAALVCVSIMGRHLKH